MPACKSSITFVIRGPVIQENMAQVSAQRLRRGQEVRGCGSRGFVYSICLRYAVESRAQVVASTRWLQECRCCERSHKMALSTSSHRGSTRSRHGAGTRCLCSQSCTPRVQEGASDRALTVSAHLGGGNCWRRSPTASSTCACCEVFTSS